MCTMSAVFDQFYDRWSQPPYVQPIPGVGTPLVITPAEIIEFRELLEKARQWDIENNEPDCESAEKRRKLQELADELGVEIEFV